MSRGYICNGWYIGYEGQLMSEYILFFIFLSRLQLLALILLLWSTYRIISNSFVLSRFEFIFGMEVPLSDKHQPHISLLW